MSKLVIANWKLHPESVRRAEGLAASSDHKNVVVCPPFVYLSAIKRVLKKAKLGAQDTFWADEGSYTGEVSPSQLKDFGVKYVIVGHSERRYLLQEGDDLINQKVGASLKTGLRVVLCVGEDLEAHERGKEHVELFVKDQLRKSLKNINSKYLKNLIVAYEPVWAISTSGTGLDDTPEESSQIIAEIKTFLAKEYRIADPKVIYGGSVDGESAPEYLSDPDIDGVLVGGASLNPKEFNKIVEICS